MSLDMTLKYHFVPYRYPGGRCNAEAMDELAELKALRAGGVRRVRFGEREVWYRNDAGAITLSRN
jgi:hypothetical protein